MPNYRQTSISGQAWTRAHNVSILNPLGAVSTCIFSEETVVEVADGQYVRQPVGSCSDDFTSQNASEAFNLIHPETGAVLGSATYQDVYILMASLYMHVANKRDVAEAERAAYIAQMEAARNAEPPPADPLPTPAPGA